MAELWVKRGRMSGSEIVNLKNGNYKSNSRKTYSPKNATIPVLMTQADREVKHRLHGKKPSVHRSGNSIRENEHPSN